MKFGAWIVSIAIHVIVLAAFGIAKFSNTADPAIEKNTPTAKVNQIKKMINANPVIPKPKIKKNLAQKIIKKNTRILDILPPNLQTSPEPFKPNINQNDFSDSEVLSRGVEFFGSLTDERKICYLVDCSGSMYGLFGQVQKKLKSSISTLQFDQYFYIIFFGSDRLFESGDGRLLRATEKNKSAAYDFIDSVRPAGQTNAMKALKRAMQIRDTKGNKPSLVYFLTDGFELTTKDQNSFSRKIEALLRRSAPQTKINTIGFWSQEDDRKMLETIAKQSKGQAVFITDTN